jgi:fibronectin-binding autotransporter adhesin
VSSYDLTKTGAGTLRLAGTMVNDIDSMRVGGGMLELAKIGTNALSGSLSITSGVARLMDDHQISDFATVSVTGAGRLELNGQTELIGALSGDGTVELSERLLRTARLTVKRGNFAGRMTGAGTFIKTSSDGLVLTGVNPFIGSTVLQEGELRMDNVQTNSTIRLDGGLLTGRGFVGPITGNAGGTVAPGFGGPQYQSALRSRDVTFNSTTTFRTVITSSSPDFEGHKLQVAGAVNLGNSVLAIDVYSTFRPTNGASWVVIENDGNDPVAGTFGGLPEGATLAGEGWLFQVSYSGGTGNDVVLRRVPAPPATLTTIELLDNTTRIRGSGQSGLRYQLQTTTNLNPVIQWQQVGEIIPDANGAFQTGRYLFPASQQRFFRVISQ